MTKQVGNAAKMREACANIAEYAKAATCYTENSHLLGYLYQIEEWAESALSALPRNCDVLSKDEVLKVLDDRSFSKEDTIEWLYAEVKGETK